jgi:predicted transcriptional regulator
MTIAKHTVKKVIDSLPDDISYDEIIKALAFDRMIKRGLDDSEHGRTISNHEIKQRIKQWQQ